jgi:hypothetical protein
MEQAIKKCWEQINRDQIIDAITSEVMCMDLTKAKQEGLEKFLKGRKEHGECYKEIEFKKEIREEIVDIVNYIVMEVESNN